MAHVKLGRLYEILFCGMFSLMNASNVHIIGEPNHVGVSLICIDQLSINVVCLFSRSAVVISNKSRGLLKEKVTLSSPRGFRRGDAGGISVYCA